MKDLGKYDEIIIWGACFSPEEIEGEATSHGHAAEKLYILLKNNHYDNKIIMWVDSNNKLYGKHKYGKPVCHPAEILKHKSALIIINSLSIEAILKSAESMGIKNEIMIIPYYYYHGVLDHAYDNKTARRVIEENREEIRELFYLDDDKTECYLNIIFNLRMQEEDLFSREFYQGTGEKMDYFCDDFLAPKGEVTYIDVGAFEGESIEPIRRKYGSRMKSCLAFEPDRRSYCKLKKYIDSNGLLDICKIYPYALGKEEKIIRFSETGSTSQLSETGETELQQKKFDEIEDINIIGDVLIKMDIEGAELEALQGMENFIRNEKPYLAICLYHKEEDIYSIPKYLKELCPEYRLYIRGGWHLECWAIPPKHYLEERMYKNE